MSTLTVLDWPTLLAIPDTRWYLDRGNLEYVECCRRWDCPNPVVAFVTYQVGVLPGDDDSGREYEQWVCADHLTETITYVTGEPLVAGTVVEVGVDPALLRLTGVDPAFVDAKFNKHALGVSA